MSKGPSVPNYEGPSDSVPDYDLTYAINILKLLFLHVTPVFVEVLPITFLYLITVTHILILPIFFCEEFSG